MRSRIKKLASQVPRFYLTLNLVRTYNPAMATIKEGKCPLCGSAGDIGSQCTEKACKRRGIHFIPNRYFEKVSKQEGVQFDTVIGQLIDAYLVVDKVGAGGFGKVYLGLQLPIMLEGAIKLMAPEDNRTNAEVLIKNFQQEAQSLARLTDPHIVKLQRYGVFRETPYMVMEYVNNSRTLKDAMDELAAKGEKFRLDQTTHIIRQILSGLKSTHRLQIVHRDIKPANIMLQRIEDDDFFVRIVDFGLAKFVEARTYTDTILGTPVYMAPEQITKVHIGPWTDLYAVGVICFEMITGRVPFKFRTFQELLGQKISPDYDPLEVIADQDPPEGLKTFFSMALARKHEDRYKNVDEFRVGFDHAVAELETVDAMTIGLDPFSRMVVAGGMDQEKQRIEEEKRRLEQEKDQLLSQIQVLKETKNGIEAQNVEVKEQKEGQGVQSDPDDEEDAKVTMPVQVPVPVPVIKTPEKHGDLPVQKPVEPRAESSSNLPVFIVVGILILVLGVLAFMFLNPSEYMKPADNPKPVALATKPVATTKKAVANVRPGRTQAKPKKQAEKRAKPVKKHVRAQKMSKKPVARPKKEVARKTKVIKKATKLGAAKKTPKKAKVSSKKKVGIAKLSGAKEYKKACDTGNMKACYRLAWMYSVGKGGVKKDYKQAAALYKKACDMGHLHSCLELGMLYVKGRGVHKDYNRASDLFKKACDKGSDTGCSLYDSLKLAR